MNCEQFNVWLQESLDAPGVEMAPEIRRHVNECASCRGLKNAASRLEVGLRLLPPVLPGPGLSSRIVAAVLQERRVRQRRKLRVWSAVALAASVLMSVGLLIWLRGWKSGERIASAANSALNSKNATVQDSSAGSSKSSGFSHTLGDLVAFGLRPGAESQNGHNRVGFAIEAGLRNLGSQSDTDPPQSVAEGLDGIGSLMSQRLRHTANDGKTLLDIVTPTTPDLSSGVQPSVPSPPLTDAGDGVQAGLKPVTGSARRAVDLFIREVPGMGPDKQPQN